ncbi:MATE family efflux transporter [Cohnella rhizosphaerae]|uniref:MATE family efflux transporter n=1 Tax=Cohnella rhizosphaerae TaxID=1457232 RepID=A0A9X4KQ71_9BACL|nr:MATE family efflux transporter [Cohnella rhizosphaerae]MDG0808757.1 MATE family efflux transporter [Cohnella rhizosphaerae]
MELDKKMKLGRLTWPIMIEMFLAFAIGTSDTLMVSRISDDAVAVVGFSNQFFNAVIVVFMLVASGAGILIANRLGAGDAYAARKLAIVSVVLTGAIGLVVSLLMVFGAGQIAGWLGMPPDIRPLANDYMSIVGGGMIFTAIGNALSTAVRNTGNTRSPMYIAIMMNVVHIFLNALFIFGLLGFPKWGLFGVALSTLFVRAASVVLLLYVFRSAFGGRIGFREFLRPDWSRSREILRIGWPLSMNGGSWQLSQLAITGLIGVMGAQQLAARTYMNTMESFAFTIGWSFAMAVQILIAYLFGQGKLREAYRSAYRAMGYGMAFVLFNTALMLLFRKQIITFFTADPWIVDMAIVLLWLNLILQPGKMLNMALGQSIVAVGDSRYMMKISIPSQWLVSVGLAYLLGIRLGWGLYGVYAGMILDEYIRGAVLYLRWRHHRKRGLFADHGDLRAGALAPAKGGLQA